MNATFTINAENTIAAFPTPDHAEASIGAGALAFASQKDLAKVAAEWPISRFVEVWNGLAGSGPEFEKMKPVKKFENRAKAVARLWSAVQVLAPAEAQPTTKASRAKKPTKAPRAAKKAAPAAEPKTPRAGSKKEQAINMLSRKNGASNQELQEAMCWLPHTVRGFICGALRKTGVAVESFKRTNGDSAYRIASE
jgi:hypothetical protein